MQRGGDVAVLIGDPDVLERFSDATCRSSRQSDVLAVVVTARLGAHELHRADDTSLRRQRDRDDAGQTQRVEDRLCFAAVDRRVFECHIDHGLVDIGDVLDLARSDDGRNAGLPRRIVGVPLGQLLGPLDLGGIGMRDLELDLSARIGNEVQ